MGSQPLVYNHPRLLCDTNIRKSNAQHSVSNAVFTQTFSSWLHWGKRLAGYLNKSPGNARKARAWQRRAENVTWLITNLLCDLR